MLCNKIKTCYEQGTMAFVKNNCAVQENKDLFRARDDDYRKEQLCCAIK